MVECVFLNTSDQVNRYVNKLKVRLNSAKEAPTRKQESLKTITEECDESKRYEAKLKETLKKEKEDAK